MFVSILTNPKVNIETNLDLQPLNTKSLTQMDPKPYETPTLTILNPDPTLQPYNIDMKNYHNQLSPNPNPMLVVN